ncbi:MAG: ribonuclease III domain-containing protein [Gammaproteobacteria bacterium]|nr:ribonuclease III domain-containing protein [Gammaproteobacteria bacterium]
MFDAIDANYKNRLLEIAARDFGVARPHYFHSEYGPDHAKVFSCTCRFLGEVTVSKERTKVEAEQATSQQMLEIIQSPFFTYKDGKWSLAKASLLTVTPELTKEMEGLPADPQFDVFSLYGDAVLRYWIVRDLFDRYPQFQEGILTRIISEALQDDSRAEIADKMGLAPYVRTLATPRVLAQTLSAVIGKLTLSGTESICKSLIMDCYRSFTNSAVATILGSKIADKDVVMSASISTTVHNFKAELLNHSQKCGLAAPEYEMLSFSGAAHERMFIAECRYEGLAATGRAKTIKAAEQEAAGEVLTLLRKTDAASMRTIKHSSASHVKNSKIKRFKMKELFHLKEIIKWHYFKTLDHLALAFTHPGKGADNYQRLEFLGDALLKMIVLQYVLKTYPGLRDKAYLSPRINILISADTQADVAKSLCLDKFIFSDVMPTDIILGDVLEALIAAIYLDAAGKMLCSAEHVITSWFKNKIELTFGKPERAVTTFFESSAKAKSSFTLSDYCAFK